MNKQQKLELAKEYRQALDVMRKLEAEYDKIAKDVFKLEAFELFDAHPQLIAFGWRQFTPGFNDGEPCRFRCYKDSPMVNGIDEYGDEDTDVEKYPELSKKEQKVLLGVVSKFLEGYEEHNLEAMFGDCVKVKVTRKEIETEEYQPY